MHAVGLASMNAQIVDALHTLADGWKSVATELAPAAAPGKKRRAKAPRAARLQDSPRR
jgi:hypothetical protein